MASDECIKTYVAKRTAEGKTTGEVTRVFKRYAAREIYPHLPPTMN
jgi:transposase